MSLNEEWRQFSNTSSPDRKLKALRRLLVGPAATVQGVVSLLRQYDADIAACLPEDVKPQEFDQMIDWLAAAGCDLQKIIDALPVAAKAALQE
jgi:hypothetical protein